MDSTVMGQLQPKWDGSLNFRNAEGRLLARRSGWIGER